MAGAKVRLVETLPIDALLGGEESSPALSPRTLKTINRLMSGYEANPSAASKNSPTPISNDLVRRLLRGAMEKYSSDRTSAAAAIAAEPGSQLKAELAQRVMPLVAQCVMLAGDLLKLLM